MHRHALSMPGGISALFPGNDRLDLTLALIILFRKNLSCFSSSIFQEQKEPPNDSTTNRLFISTNSSLPCCQLIRKFMTLPIFITRYTNRSKKELHVVIKCNYSLVDRGCLFTYVNGKFKDGEIHRICKDDNG